MTEKLYKIELDEDDLGQLLDGLEIRVESWRRTAEFLRTEEIPEGESFIIEECSDHEEADGLAARYEAISKTFKARWRCSLEPARLLHFHRHDLSGGNSIRD